MSQAQYLKMLERELNKLNRVIDYKIVNGENYSREARDHKLILKKVRYIHNARRGWLARLVGSMSFRVFAH
ncbi:MAG: hypothetical protein ACK4FA_00720 [Candidatus Paceibacteria bacterium]